MGIYHPGGEAPPPLLIKEGSRSDKRKVFQIHHRGQPKLLPLLLSRRGAKRVKDNS